MKVRLNHHALTTLTFVLAFVVGLSLSLYWSARTPTGTLPVVILPETPTPKLEVPAEPVTSKRPEPTKQWKLLTKDFVDVNKRLRYSIQGEYPVLRGLGRSRNSQFNTEIHRLISNRYADMTKPDLRELRDDIHRSPTVEIMRTAEFNYDEMAGPSGILSIRFNESTYWWPAGGGSQNYFTINYDSQTKKILKLRDLFDPKFNHLRFLSKFCSKALQVMEWWADGVSPRAENFASWNITREGLVIGFQECQVSACSVGTQEVKIPFSELKSHLNKRIASRITDD
jgi:hypothetical protein